MTFIGFGVNKKEREELLGLTRDMATMSFKHPGTGQVIQFLPPGAGLGTLVKVATSEYIRYFNALREGATQAQASSRAQQQAQQQPQLDSQLDSTQVAQQAIARSQAMRAGLASQSDG